MPVPLGPLLFGDFFNFVLEFMLFCASGFMILLVLVQRGRGGGLTGALGGMGGQSAFGAKAGDVFTKITVISAIIWIFLCLITIMRYTYVTVDNSNVGEYNYEALLGDPAAADQNELGKNPDDGPGMKMSSTDSAEDRREFEANENSSDDNSSDDNQSDGSKTGQPKAGQDDDPKDANAKSTDPKSTDPKSTEPKSTEPKSTDPKSTEPAKDDKTQADPKAEKGDGTGEGKTDQAKAGENKAEGGTAPKK